MINRLPHSRLGNISFVVLVTIPYFVPRSLCPLVTKYDIVSRAIKDMSKLTCFPFFQQSLDGNINKFAIIRHVCNYASGDVLSWGRFDWLPMLVN